MSFLSFLRVWRYELAAGRARAGSGKKRTSPWKKRRPAVELLEERLPAGAFFNGFGLGAAHTLPVGIHVPRHPAPRHHARPVAHPALHNGLDQPTPAFNVAHSIMAGFGGGTASVAVSFAQGNGTTADGSTPNSGSLFDNGLPQDAGSTVQFATLPAAVAAPSGSATTSGGAGGTMIAPSGFSASPTPATGSTDDSTFLNAVSTGIIGSGSTATASEGPSSGTGISPLGVPRSQGHVREIPTGLPTFSGGPVGESPPVSSGAGFPSGGSGTGSSPTGGITREATPLAGPAASSPVGQIVDASQFIGGPGWNQFETEIAINPTNPNNLLVASNVLAAPLTNGGLMVSTSFDGGASWFARIIANGVDQFDPACCDPSVAFDNFGNAFVSYFDASTDHAVLLLSADGGMSFKQLARFADCFDQPKIAVGHNEIWDVFTSISTGSMEGKAAVIHHLGFVDRFFDFQVPNPSTMINFGRAAVGPSGQLLQSFQTDPLAGQIVPIDLIRTSFVRGINIVQGFSPERSAAFTRVGFVNSLPPPIPDRISDAKSSVAYDNSFGPHRGRAYMVYMDRANLTTTDYEIYLKHSDDNGVTWSPRVRVANDTTKRPKWHPRVAVDPTSGVVAVSFYDSRNDNGTHNAADLDGVPGDEGEQFIAFSFDGGNTFTNIQVSKHASSAILNPNSGNDYGDYQGLAFYGGVARPAWSDNSLDIASIDLDVPNTFNIATAPVFVSRVIASGGGGGGGGSTAAFPDDSLEPNDTSNAATNLGVLSGNQSVDNLTINVHSNGLPDRDWFRWTAGSTGTFTAVENTDKGGPLELHLYKLVNGVLTNVGNDTSSSNPKTLTAAVNAGDVVLVQVKGKNISPGVFTTGAYHLDVSL